MTPRVVVVGLGPAGPDLLTAAALDALDTVPVRFLRTTRHPAASAVRGATAFDDVYDAGTTIEDVYGTIVERLVEAARREGEVLYAVPGSPIVAERTVELLAADRRVAVDILPAVSFLDLAWARLGVDPLAAGARLVDGRRFAVEAAGERGPLLVAQCDRAHVLSEIKLAVDEPVRTPVTVLQRLGLPDEAVFDVAWYDLDRAVEPDHLTSLWIPRLAAPVAAELVRFAELVRTLRAQCPWDREQTHRTLTRHLLEETYEALEAIENLDVAEGTGFDHLEEELGDVLFQVVFHATLAAEEGQFTLADVARTVHDKLVRRHPHVFGDVTVEGADDVVRNWEQIKKAEKGRTSVMDGLPGNLPALVYAVKVQRKAASVLGDGLPGVPTLDDALAALDRTRGRTGEDLDAAIGDVLFAVAALARSSDVDPEAALRAAAARYRDHVREREHALDTPDGA